MAKITQPKGKLVRRFGVNIYANPKYDRLLERRSDPPGQHGAKHIRRKTSNYGLQLIEKQKLRYTYGLLEKQFRSAFKKALRQKGVTGENLLALLESRLDSAVFRAGFAVTRMQARQLVNHGHLQVNGRKVDIPSYTLKVGDVVTVGDKEISKNLIARCSAESRRFQPAGWISVDQEQLSFSITHPPTKEEIASPVNEQLIVELYSR